MGPEASLKILHLSTGASIDDAHGAFTQLQQDISSFHRKADGDSDADFQEDIEILTCAYECAIAYLSENSQPHDSAPDRGGSRPFNHTEVQSRIDLHDVKQSKTADSVPLVSDSFMSHDKAHRTVEEAIVITSRRLHEAESALPGAQKAVNIARVSVEKAMMRVEKAKQANLNTIVSAKSAKIRALLLDVEANKAEKAAQKVAEKARERAVAARKAAEEARRLAEREKQQVIRVKKSEEAATAEVICAEDKMERDVARLKSLEQKLLETRNCMRMFQETTDAIEGEKRQTVARFPASLSGSTVITAKAGDDGSMPHDSLLSDLQNVEVFDDVENQPPKSEPVLETVKKKGSGVNNERRRHPRIIYPLNRQPSFTIDDQALPVIDLSSKGMRLGSMDDMDRSIIRGSIDFPGEMPLNLVGRVVRKDSGEMGIKLVTHIGKWVLEKERLRLAV